MRIVLFITVALVEGIIYSEFTPLRKIQRCASRRPDFCYGSYGLTMNIGTFTTVLHERSSVICLLFYS